jgi:tRNA threonylcarbamoyladenosine modification (KEOPS) complex Cgi121 subunit
MIYLAGSSDLSMEELEKKARDCGALLLNPSKVSSEEELFLAEALSKNAISEKRNIAKNREVEFLLWLSAKTNIQSAQSEYWFRTSENVLVVSLDGIKNKNELASKFGIREPKASLKKRAGTKEIEKISLSRI